MGGHIKIINQKGLHGYLRNNNVLCINLKGSSETQSPSNKPDVPRTTNGNQFHSKQEMN